MNQTAGDLIRLARTGHGLSQRALADRAGIAQPNIAAIESHGRDATVATTDRLVTAAGSRITVLPTRSPTAADVGARVAQQLQAHRPERAYRAVLGLHDSLTSAEPALRVALVVTPPTPTGDRRWDALLAAVVAHDLVGLPLPSWVRDPERRADGWFVDDVPELRDRTRRRTPPAFRRRGVFIDPAELESV